MCMAWSIAPACSREASTEEGLSDKGLDLLELSPKFVPLLSHRLEPLLRVLLG